MKASMKRNLCALLLAALCLCTCAPALAATITGSSTPEALAASGNVTLTLAIYNDGAAAMTDIHILNNGNEFFQTAGVVIDPGQTQTFSATVTVPEALIGQPITFSITWQENGESKSGTASVTVRDASDPFSQLPQAVSLSATRTVSASQASTGEIITITYTVTNSGVTPITGVSITDREIGGREPMVTGVTVEPGVPYVFTYEFTMGRTTVTSAPVISYLLADGTQSSVTVADKVLGMINSRLTVDVQQGVATEEGQTFTLILTNDGNQRISRIQIEDELGASVAESFQLAIGESKTLTYSVPTTAARNVVFYITGVDGADQQYSDHTSAYAVREYIDPSLIGINFAASVVEMLDASGAITVNFTVENTGSLTMQNLVLREGEYGEIYRLDSFAPGTQTINQKINVGTPRDLAFTLDIADPSGNQYTYTAYVMADYVGEELAATPAPGIETEPDIIADVGSSVSSALRTVLIVLGVLTVLAGIALIILTNLEREERRRIARRRAARERKLREQALEAAGMLPRSGAQPPDGETRSFPRPRE